MAETPKLRLPLIAPAQAQKHVTVNEAFARLDALAQLTLASRSRGVPPASAPAGTCYAVPAGASGVWSGQAGKVAIAMDGGWDFVAPVAGWRAWVADEGVEAVFAGGVWVSGVLSLSPNGAGTVWRVVEIDHAVTAGATGTSALVIPAKAMVFGVTARVTATMPGTATTWRMGVAGATNRFGSGLGLAAGAFAQGILGTPTVQWDATPVVIGADGGTFSGGGVVRIAAHYLELTVPAA